MAIFQPTRSGHRDDLSKPDRRCLAAVLIAFILVTVPSLCAIALITGPFQTLDESSHFYRAVQLSEGGVRPIIAPNRKSAGAYLDANIQQLGSYYLYVSYQKWSADYTPSPRDDRRSWQLPLAHRSVFVPFSNTVIYFPTAHLVPAVAIRLARLAQAPPLAWLYAARLANAALAVVIYCLALAVSSRARPFIFVVALLPRTMFGTAAVSADALLVPFACLFAALLARLHDERRLSSGQAIALGCAGLFVGLSKLAYIPLVVLPPVFAIRVNHHRSAVMAILVGTTLLTVLLWLGWLTSISGSAFPIRHNVPIDIYGQLRDVLHRPSHGVAVLWRSLHKDGFGYLDTLAGGQLGSAAVRFDYLPTLLLLLLLTGSAFVARPSARFAAMAFGLSAATVAASSVAIFLLLYMQYTALGAATVDGVQGRYFLPLLPVAAVFLPKYELPPAWRGGVMAAALVGLVAAQVDTSALLSARYLRHRSTEDVLITDPRHHLAE